MIQVAIIDDEDVITLGYKTQISRELQQGARFYTFDRPSEFRNSDVLSRLTHALVDLSFGPESPDGSAELETGVDVIDLLVTCNPACKIAVVTRLDTDLHFEMAIAIRQLWPAVVFYHKGDKGVVGRLETFLSDEGARDDNRIKMQLAGVEPVSEQRLGLVLDGLVRTVPVLKALCALADFIQCPTRMQLAGNTGYADNYVKNLVAEGGEALRNSGILPEQDLGGVRNLWLWVRARRPVLRRELSRRQ